jgi:hypothetical protein
MYSWFLEIMYKMLKSGFECHNHNRKNPKTLNIQRAISSSFELRFEHLF